MTKWNLDQAATTIWIPVAELAPHQISGAQNRIFGELRSAVLFVMDELPPGDRGVAMIHPSRKWPNAASGRTRSQIILAIASMGTARIAPEIPHIQNQKTSAIMTRTGLRVNRLATSIGVTVSPSIK